RHLIAPRRSTAHGTSPAPPPRPVGRDHGPAPPPRPPPRRPRPRPARRLAGRDPAPPAATAPRRPQRSMVRRRFEPSRASKSREVIERSEPPGGRGEPGWGSAALGVPPGPAAGAALAAVRAEAADDRGAEEQHDDADDHRVDDVAPAAHVRPPVAQRVAEADERAVVDAAAQRREAEEAHHP